MVGGRTEIHRPSPLRLVRRLRCSPRGGRSCGVELDPENGHLPCLRCNAQLQAADPSTARSPGVEFDRGFPGASARRKYDKLHAKRGAHWLRPPRLEKSTRGGRISDAYVPHPTLIYVSHVRARVCGGAVGATCSRWRRAGFTARDRGPRQAEAPTVSVSHRRLTRREGRWTGEPGTVASEFDCLHSGGLGVSRRRRSWLLSL